MSIRLRQRIALLLVAVMALLPLQGAHASWSGQGNPDHCRHAESSGEHGGHHAQKTFHKGDCCASQATGDGGADHQCNNCDLCGSATAAVFNLPVTAASPLRDTPLTFESTAATVQRHSPLLRPPSTLL